MMSIAAKVAGNLTSAPAQIAWVLVISLMLYASAPGWIWLDVRAVNVQPSWSYTEQSRAPVITVDREISGYIHARWTAEIQKQGPSGWHDACPSSPSGVATYDSDSVLPPRVDLDWWAAGQCPAKYLESGTYRLRTTWTWDAAFGVSRRVQVTSNLFVIE